VPLDGAVELTWSTPDNSGGSEVSGYVIVIDGPALGFVETGVVTTTVVGGLTNGSAYRFEVIAVNDSGHGEPSEWSNVVVPAVPPAEAIATPARGAAVTPTPEPGAVAEDGARHSQTIELKPGWNLISLRVLPDDVGVLSVLGPISGLYSEVSTLDGASTSVYRPGAAKTQNTLKFFNPLRAYWIRVTQAATLVVTGSEVNPTSPLRLNAGWNLISYLPSRPMPVAVALGAVWDGVAEVRSFDEEGVAYLREELGANNTLVNMEPGRGYLVYMTEARDLVYPE
jgi:hypothetical protein